MLKNRLNLRNLAAITASLAIIIFASCKKETLDLSGSVNISPTENVFVGNELTAAYNGFETVTWHWNKNGIVIGGATTNKYTPVETGIYTATASATGYNSKSSIAVDVKPAPIYLLEEKLYYSTRNVYEYDSQDRISKISKYLLNNNQPFDVQIFNYNSEGHLEEIINGSKITFSKNGNKITYNNYEVEHNEIEINDQGFPVKYTWEIKYDKYWIIRTNTFTWLNGNLTEYYMEEKKKIGYEESTNYSTATYTFDDKKSPFYHCKTPKWVLFYFMWSSELDYNDNNVKTIKWESESHTTYEYIYNDEGFPIYHFGQWMIVGYRYKKK